MPTLERNDAVSELAVVPFEALSAAPQPEALMAQARKACEFLKALSHENRLVLLCLLSQQERTVTEMARLLGIRQPTISQQLGRLRLDGLVNARRDGKAVFYSLANEDVRETIALLHRLFCKQAGC